MRNFLNCRKLLVLFRSFFCPFLHSQPFFEDFLVSKSLRVLIQSILYTRKFSYITAKFIEKDEKTIWLTVSMENPRKYQEPCDSLVPKIGNRTTQSKIFKAKRNSIEKIFAIYIIRLAFYCLAGCFSPVAHNR